MDNAIMSLQHAVASMESKIETLDWKINKVERVLFSENKLPHSCTIMSMLIRLAETCRKYDELVSLISEHRNEQVAFTDTLQLQINLLRSKVETLTALITKGRTIEF